MELHVGPSIIVFSRHLQVTSWRAGLKRRRFFVAIDFSKYEGRYVAIVGRRIVASGNDAEQVWSHAKRKHPDAQPELFKVSKGETLVLIICG